MRNQLTAALCGGSRAVCAVTVAVLLAVASGCSLHGPETVELRYSDQLCRAVPAENPSQGVAENAGAIAVIEADGSARLVSPPLSPPPDGSVAVRATVVEVRRALLESHSFGGEESHAIFRIAVGDTIPDRPGATRIMLRFHGLLVNHEFNRGDAAVFWFTRGGEFFRIEEATPAPPNRSLFSMALW